MSIHIFDIDTRCNVDFPEAKEALEKLFEKMTGWIDVFGKKDGHHFQIAEVYINGIDINIDIIEEGIESFDNIDPTMAEILCVTRQFIEY